MVSVDVKHHVYLLTCDPTNQQWNDQQPTSVLRLVITCRLSPWPGSCWVSTAAEATSLKAWVWRHFPWRRQCRHCGCRECCVWSSDWWLLLTVCRSRHRRGLARDDGDLTSRLLIHLIIKISIKRKILSVQTILSAYAHTNTHTQAPAYTSIRTT